MSLTGRALDSRWRACPNVAPSCCYARSGPIVYASVPIPRPPAPSGWSFFHGSQWVVLAREAASWLVRDARAAAFARHVRLTYMADETYVQSALMASPHRSRLVNHNLRYIDWPHGYGDPNAYYHTVRAPPAPLLYSPSR